MRGRLRLFGAIAGLSVSSYTSSAIANDAIEKGRAIAVEADHRDSGWGDLSSEIEMVLRNRQGESSTRRLRLQSLEVDGDGDRMLLTFDHPADVKGTALLTYSHELDPDDQWLYLPALKRIKRISSSNRSGPFVGSEFSYEDFTSREIDKYTYVYLRDERLNGMECFVVERRPVDQDSGYSRQVSWLDKTEYRLQKIDFYDRKDEKLKTLTFTGYQQYLERHWRASELIMENHQNGKSTELRFLDYRFRDGLTPRDFDRNALKRAR